MDVNCSKLPHTPGWHYIANILVRSAVFHSPLPKGKRYIVSEPRDIPSLGNYALKQHAGEQLAQNDLDVFLGVASKLTELETAGYSAPGEFVSIRLSKLFYACARTTGNYASLLEHFVRLAEAKFTATLRDFPGVDLSTTPWSLIDLVNDGGWEINVRLSHEYRKLLMLESTGICDEQRRRLTQDGQWLHAFFSSHTHNLPLTPLNIGRLMGRSKEQAISIEPMLIRQLAKLSAVTGWDCSLKTGKTLIKKYSKGKGYNSRTKKTNKKGVNDQCDNFKDDVI